MIELPRDTTELVWCNVCKQHSTQYTDTELVCKHSVDIDVFKSNHKFEIIQEIVNLDYKSIIYI